MINYTSFFDDEAYETNTLIEMYEGEQTERIIRILDGNGCNGFGKRSNWRENGIIPRTRNIMQGIVNKSSTLFNKPPSLMIWPSGNKTKGFVDNTFNSLMYQSDWKSFFQNVCRYTRLLKTTVVLAERIVPVDTITENGIYTFNPSRVIH
jgi:hypothetical protein